MCGFFDLLTALLWMAGAASGSTADGPAFFSQAEALYQTGGPERFAPFDMLGAGAGWGSAPSGGNTKGAGRPLPALSQSDPVRFDAPRAVSTRPHPDLPRSFWGVTKDMIRDSERPSSGPTPQGVARSYQGLTARRYRL
jgi:hypothetical protein